MRKGMIGVCAALGGIGVGLFLESKVKKGTIRKLSEMSDKHLALFLMMHQWVKIKQEGKSIVGYLKQKGYQNIAVYGMSYAGEALLNELKDSGICIKYAIDKKADRIYADVKLVTMEERLEEVDAVIVTAITFFDQISDKIEEKLKCPILSLEDILHEV